MNQDIVERLRAVGEGVREPSCFEAADTIESLRARVKELERPDFRQMREMLRAMQAGELTVSRGIEILDMWHAGNWNDDMLPPVRQDLIEEDSMPVEIIDRLRARVAELEAEADPEAPHIAYLHGQADRNQQLTAKDQRIAELEALCAEKNGIIQRMGMGIKDKDRLIAQLIRDAEMYGPNKLAIEKQAWVMADSVREIRELRDKLAAKDKRIAELESFPTMAAVRKTVESKVAEENTRLYQRIAELEEQLENEQARGIHTCHPGCSRDGCVNRRLREQLAAQALTIKTMREALEKFIDSHEECTDFDGFTAQVVSMDDYHKAQEALALPDNSTEILQEWLDKQLGDPPVVWQIGSNLCESFLHTVTSEKELEEYLNHGWKIRTVTYRKPEIK